MPNCRPPWRPTCRASPSRSCRRSFSTPSGAPSRSDYGKAEVGEPRSDHRIVVGVRADPEPQQPFLDFDSQRAITAAHADRPEPADLLQLEGRVARILFE